MIKLGVNRNGPGRSAGNRHESGREQVAQSAEAPDHQSRVARGDVLTESKVKALCVLPWALRCGPLRDDR